MSRQRDVPAAEAVGRSANNSGMRGRVRGLGDERELIGHGAEQIAVGSHLCCRYRRQGDALIGLVCLVTRSEHSLATVVQLASLNNRKEVVRRARPLE
jgi:hypothetical protein